MAWLNNSQRYGILAAGLHWLLAVATIGLFGLGWWMVELDYGHSWYRQAPWIHRSAGILVAIAMLIRLLIRYWDKPPAHEASLSRFEVTSARVTHIALYLLIFTICISGYLISTADGRPVDVFSWFNVPALIKGVDNQEDIAGEIHEWLAWLFVALVTLHSLAALKHHFIDKDRTLLKMLGR